MEAFDDKCATCALRANADGMGPTLWCGHIRAEDTEGQTQSEMRAEGGPCGPSAALHMPE